jgi:hypothetical protein
MAQEKMSSENNLIMKDGAPNFIQKAREELMSQERSQRSGKQLH